MAATLESRQASVENLGACTAVGTIAAIVLDTVETGKHPEWLTVVLATALELLVG